MHILMMEKSFNIKLSKLKKIINAYTPYDGEEL